MPNIQARLGPPCTKLPRNARHSSRCPDPVSWADHCFVPVSDAGLRFEDEQPFSTRFDDWEPTVAADNFGHVYIATTRYGGPKACTKCPDPAVVYKVSADGGDTWSGPHFVCRCRSADGQHDPVLATDDSGRVFMTWMNDFKDHFAGSDDFGVTWTKPHRLDLSLPWSDKPWLDVSPDGNHVYIVYNHNNPFAVYSHNAGATWSAPIPVHKDPTRYYVSGGLAVTRDGVVVSSQTAYHRDETGDILIVLLRSTDGGRTWHRVLIDRARRQPPCPVNAGCSAAFFGAQMAVATDGVGRLYVLYNANAKPEGPARLYMRRSEDGGETWSERVQVSSASPVVDHEFPMIAAAGDGDVRAAWMDDRTGRWNVFYRRSIDAGKTWDKTVRLSDQASGAPYKTARGFAFPYGDYGDIDIGGASAHVTWGEGPSYRGPGDTWFTRGL